MTREEAEEYAKEMTYRDAVCNALQGRCIPYRKATLIKLYELLDRLEQEPCEDAINREDALMALTGEWTEITDEIIHRFIKRIKALPPVNPQPCEDAISRQAVLDKKELVELEDGQSFYCISPEDVETLPPVNPQPKIGHWINGDCKGGNCSICGEYYAFYPESGDFNYCPNCGAKMSEIPTGSDPQESEKVN